MADPVFDNRLRPVVEYLPAVVLLGFSWILFQSPQFIFPLLPGLGNIFAVAFALLGLWRGWQGMAIVRYQRQLTRLPLYELDAKDIPMSRHKMFLGRGFRWDQRHSQRLIEARSPSSRKWLQQGLFYRLTRAFSQTLATPRRRSSYPWRWIRG